MEMLEWVKQVFAHNWITGALVTVLPQESYARESVSPFTNARMEYVVVITYNASKNEYAIGRVWKCNVERGRIAWENGRYVRNDFTRALTSAVTASQF